MSELEKYELVNKCETIEELRYAILQLSNDNNQIEGRERFFNGERMSDNVLNVVNGYGSPNLLTRKYGIRQQALYIKYYEK